MIDSENVLNQRNSSQCRFYRRETVNGTDTVYDKELFVAFQLREFFGTLSAEKRLWHFIQNTHLKCFKVIVTDFCGEILHLKAKNEFMEMRINFEKEFFYEFWTVYLWPVIVKFVLIGKMNVSPAHSEILERSH